MHVDRLQSILGLLSLLGPSAVRASTHTFPPTQDQEHECSLQAWVRAPDLVPNTIIQGDARLKLTTGCTSVESASLGLRFKERSFVKASRSIEATKRPEENPLIDIFDSEHASPSSPWVLPLHEGVNHSARLAFDDVVKNKDLWLVREEERIVFESMQVIDMGEAQLASVRDVVRDFAILIPSTNFPPALDYSPSLVELRGEEFVNVEAMYEYFIRVTFANGTMVEIPAGFTAFHPLYDPPNTDLVRSKTVQLQMRELLNGSAVRNNPSESYTAEIISKLDGFAFSQGSDDQFIEVVVTRTGHARTFVEPLTLHLCIDSSLSPRWASEYTSNPTLQSVHKPNQILRASSADFKPTKSPSTSRCIPHHNGHTPHPKHVFMPNATSNQIAAGDTVTTTSQPVQFLIDADPRHTTDFETYYSTLSSALFLTLGVPRTQDEPSDLADGFELRAIRKKSPVVEADEEPWVPWYSVPEVVRWRGLRMYTGNVSVSVYPDEALIPRHRVRATPASANGVDGAQQVNFASPEHEHHHSQCACRSPVHYLVKGARAPTFVNSSVMNVEALLAKTPAERDALAPLLEPVVSPLLAGEERVHRYYRVPEGHRPLIYVGETWVKKVAHRDEHMITTSRPDTMPSALAEMTAVMMRMIDEL